MPRTYLIFGEIEGVGADRHSGRNKIEITYGLGQRMCLRPREKMQGGIVRDFADLDRLKRHLQHLRQSGHLSAMRDTFGASWCRSSTRFAPSTEERRLTPVTSLPAD
jgi:hypothetical protein